MYQSIASRIADGADSDRICFRFLDRGETECATLTFAELDSRARSLAVGLLGPAAPGDRVLLVFEPGPEFIEALAACLYAGLVAIPAPASARIASPRGPIGVARMKRACGTRGT